MKTAGAFWLGLFIGSFVAGATGYWLGSRVHPGGVPVAQPLPAGSGGQASAAADFEPNPIGNECSQDLFGLLGPEGLLDCLRQSADAIESAITAFQYYFSHVIASRAQVSSLVDVLAEKGSDAPDQLLAYIEAETDREKIGLAAEALKTLLTRQGKALASGGDVGWLIEHLNRLLWLTPDDVSLNLWLAKLFLQQGQIEDVRYHALIAANAPAYVEEAGDLLRHINGEAEDDGSIVIDLEVSGNQYFIAARVNGNPARLLLDTGASISGLSSRFIEKYPAIVGETQSIVLSTAGGLKTGRKFTADELSFGELAFSQHDMVIFADVSFKGFDGVLGVDVLRQADFFIDRKESKLRIYPQN